MLSDLSQKIQKFYIEVWQKSNFDCLEVEEIEAGEELEVVIRLRFVPCMVKKYFAVNMRFCEDYKICCNKVIMTYPFCCSFFPDIL